MANVRSLTISATAALLLVAGGGCAGSSSELPSSSPSTTAPSSTATTASSPEVTPSPTAPPSKAELAAQHASRAVRRYFFVVDELRQRPSQALSALSTVATSVQLSAQEKLVQGERDKGLRQTGATRVAELTVQAVNLENSDPDAGRVPTATIDVCWNVADVDIVDRRGRSVVAPARPETGWTRFTVANYHWSGNPMNGWRVATGLDLKKAPCAAA